MLHRFKRLQKEIDKDRYWYEKNNYLPSDLRYDNGKIKFTGDKGIKWEVFKGKKGFTIVRDNTVYSEIKAVYKAYDDYRCNLHCHGYNNNTVLIICAYSTDRNWESVRHDAIACMIIEHCIPWGIE